MLQERPEVKVDYLELRNAGLGELADDEYAGKAGEVEARLLVAARVGTTRLIDNVGVILGSTSPQDQLAQQQREIAAAALNAAGLDSELSEEEMAQLAELQQKVHQVRDARLAQQAARDSIKNVGFTAEREGDKVAEENPGGDA